MPEEWQVGLITFAVIAGMVGLLVAAVKASGASSEFRHAKNIKRAERITDLVAAIAGGSTEKNLIAELSQLVRESPISYAPQLLTSGGWFERSGAGLTMLIGTAERSIVDWYFICFRNCWNHGTRERILWWIHRTAHTYVNDAPALDTLATIVARLAPVFTQTEAEWIYQRALEMLELPRSEVAAAVRTFALRIGRFRYSLGRPNHTPTIYDEQAIANDITARVR